MTVVCDPEGEAPAGSQVSWLSARHRAWGRLRFPIGLDQILQGRDLLVLHSGWVYHNVQAARSAARSGVPYSLTPHGAYDPNIFKRRKNRSASGGASSSKTSSLMHGQSMCSSTSTRRTQTARLHRPSDCCPDGADGSRFQYAGSQISIPPVDGAIRHRNQGHRSLASCPRVLASECAPAGTTARPGLARRKATSQADRKRAGPRRLRGDRPSSVLRLNLKWEALRGCGLFIFPSRWEGQGLMALEAAAAAATLVVTSTTSLGRHLAAAQAAILVEPTTESIAEGIVRGYCSSNAGESGARAAQFVRERFSWPTVAESYLQQLKALL